jgi:hypothetical protein
MRKVTLTRLLTTFVVVIAAGSAWAEVCKGSGVPKADLDQYGAHSPS